MTYAEEILTLRKALKLTQEEFAKKVGVSRVQVNRWEKGRFMPSPIAGAAINKILFAYEKRTGQKIREI